MTHFLLKAKNEKFSVGQFNVITLEFADIIATVAKEEQSPVIFGAGEMSIKYMGLDYCVTVLKLAASKVGAMAIAVGSAYGMNKREPKIKTKIIQKVADAIDAPVVLHGG